MQNQTFDAILQVTSLIASIVSVVLAIVAIFLSFWFYDRSAKSSREVETATNAVRDSVHQLDRLLELLRSDAFSMVRGTLTAYEKRLLSDHASLEESEQLTETRINEKVAHLRAEMRAELISVVGKVEQTDPHVPSVRQRLEQVVDKAIDQSVKADREAREENIQDHLLSYLSTLPAEDPTMRVMKIALHFRDRFVPADICKGLVELRQANAIEFDRKIDHWTDITGDVSFTRLT